MGILDKVLEYGIGFGRRLSQLQADKKTIFIHSKSFISGKLPKHPIVYKGSEEIFIPNKDFATITEWESYQKAIPELKKLKSDYDAEFEKNRNKFYAAIAAGVIAGVKLAIDHVKEEAKTYDEMVKEVKDLVEEIKKSEDDKVEKEKALKELQSRHETWKEWFLNSKKEAEEQLTSEINELEELIAHDRKIIAENTKQCEAIEKRLIPHNDPSWGFN